VLAYKNGSNCGVICAILSDNSV